MIRCNEAEATGGHLMNLGMDKETSASDEGSSSASSSHQNAHALLGEVVGRVLSKGEDDSATLNGVSAKDMEWGGWRAHPGELARDCQANGTE